QARNGQPAPQDRHSRWRECVTARDLTLRADIADCGTPMRRSRAAAGAALLVVCASSVARAEPLAGSVVDGLTMKPIAGATVTAPGGTTTTTDRAGHF